jgi:ribosomal protein S18 acetylase RimI-like enzyme
MTDQARILVRNAREQDLPAVAEIDAESASLQHTSAAPEMLQQRLTVFPNGFIILVAGNEIAGYGCSEKRLDEQLLEAAHEPDGRNFLITALGVREKYRGKGYRSILLDKLIETAHLEGCRRVIVETANDGDLYGQRGFKIVQDRIERGSSLDVMSLDLAFISRTP